MTRRSILTLLLATWTLSCARSEGEGAAASRAAPLKIAAAADLSKAFEEVGAAFAQSGGTKPTFSFGSSGLLAKQIQEGAPFDIFAAANVSYIDDLAAKGAVVADSKALYGRGRVVVWTRKDPTRPAPKSLAELKEARFVKIAIANPEHAPYGKAAKEALTQAGVWQAVAPNVVYGENVQQTLQYAETGNADAAIVALSLAITSSGDYFVIDETLHAPLDQAMAVCGRSAKKEDAARFIAFVNGPEGRTIMRRFGFALPGETTTAATP
jgi:molybdate transport system substrate-binding protein